jgi:hypothetical protein
LYIQAKPEPVMIAGKDTGKEKNNTFFIPFAPNILAAFS